jgi:predicted phosphate transport protein (TIGR00153 family)
MIFRTISNPDPFLDLFHQSAANLREAAEYFLQMVQEYTDLPERARRLREFESRGDLITRQLYNLLNSSNVSPFEREDVHGLASRLDKVLDEIEGAGNRMYLFGIEKPSPQAIELASLILRGSQLIEKAINNLQDPSALKDTVGQIYDVENHVDKITRGATSYLFHKSTGDKQEVLHLLKWKEIYARLEHAADRMEDVANILEDIVEKSS